MKALAPPPPPVASPPPPAPKPTPPAPAIEVPFPTLPALPELPNIPGLDDMPQLTLAQVSGRGKMTDVGSTAAQKELKDAKKEIEDQAKTDSAPGTALPATNPPKQVT